MFMLEKKSKKILLTCSIALSVFITGCASLDTLTASKEVVKKNIDGSVIYPVKNGMYSEYHVNTQNINDIYHGRKPTANEIKAWDLDVMPDGTGLPQGQGSVELGDELYAEQCAMCHGDFGSGGSGYPMLSGGQGSLKNQLLKEGDEPPIKTIGSYWPYATTLFWYIKSAMPFPHPKSLTDDEVYALTAYLLSVNDITINGEELDDEYVLDRKKLLEVQMPNKDGFYPVDPSRNDLKEQRGPLAQGERCMSNCEHPGVIHIQNEITGFDPALSTTKDLPEDSGKKEVTYGQKVYEESCSACHSNKAIGAPLLGDKEAWSEVLSQGIETVYKNGINGINAMPPKGGNMDLSDEQFKKVVDYIIQSSK